MLYWDNFAHFSLEKNGERETWGNERVREIERKKERKRESEKGISFQFKTFFNFFLF